VGNSRAHGCTRVRVRTPKHRHERESEQTREGARLAMVEDQRSSSAQLGWPRPARLHAGFRTKRCTDSTVTGSLHSQGEKSTLAARPRFTVGGTSTSSAWDGKTEKSAELALSGERVCVRGCTDVRVCTKARACAH
jgi:hypothetical protein